MPAKPEAPTVFEPVLTRKLPEFMTTAVNFLPLGCIRKIVGKTFLVSL